MRDRLLKSLSVFLALILVISVISFPSIKSNASGGDVDAFVKRCYQVALGRTPSKKEIQGWSSQLNDGKACGAYVAFWFIFSDEYINKKKSNDAYVEDLYKLLLDRKSDVSGKKNWVKQLKQGRSRQEVFAGFVNSPEYYKLCKKYGITAGYWKSGYDVSRLNNVNMFVARLYKVTLNRLGDKDGQEDWTKKLLNGQITGSDCAHGFVFSPEYIKSGLTDEQYIKNLYIALMGREFDTDGYNDWAKRLQNGFTSRDNVFEGFVNSKEFTNICKDYGINKGDYKATDKVPLKKGDVIKLGKYKYEVDDEGNAIDADIEWNVLCVENDRVLVISKYVLDTMEYTKNDRRGNSYSTWETCSLRKWLNDDFYNEAFEGYEKNIPQLTLNDNRTYRYVSTDIYGRQTVITKEWNETKDKIFCLSVDEIYKYYHMMTNPGSIVRTYPHPFHGCDQNDYRLSELRGIPTPYVRAKGVESPKYKSWWTRSVGEDYVTSKTSRYYGLAESACTVSLRSLWVGPYDDDYKDFWTAGWYYDNPMWENFIGVRPAMWIAY